MPRDMDRERRARRYATWLVVAFAVVAVCYALSIPPWQNSDEPFHYFYVKALLYEKRLPTHDETYQSAHPPLYYAMAAVWALPFKGRDARFLDVWIRLLSVVLGAVSVYFLFRIGRDCFGSAEAGFGMAVLAAVNPMFAAASAVVNNDAGVIFASTIALYVMLFAMRKPGGPRAVVVCGVAAGVSCLFKINANFLPVFFCIFYFFHPENRGRGRAVLAAEVALFCAVFLAVCSWWYILGFFRLGDGVLFNPLGECVPNPLYVPANAYWFVKTMMLNFWLVNDYLRGAPYGLPMVLKALYFGMSVVLVLVVAACVVPALKKMDGTRRHQLFGMFFCLVLFLGQQYKLNSMVGSVAQARYVFVMYAAVAAVVILPLREVAGAWFEKIILVACTAGFLLHFVWIFLYLRHISEINFGII